MGFDELLYPKRAELTFAWLQNILKRGLDRATDLMQILKDGTVLCQVLDMIWPGSMPERTSNPSEIENVITFLIGCEKIGVPKECTFEVADLVQRKNPMKVLQTLFYINALIKLSNLDFPFIPDCDPNTILKWKASPPSEKLPVFGSPVVANVTSSLSIEGLSAAIPTPPSMPPPSNAPPRLTIETASFENASSPNSSRPNSAKMFKTKSFASMLPSPVITSRRLSELPAIPTNSTAPRPARSTQPESVRGLIEKIDTLSATQRQLFQTCASYSSKLESLEYVNKSLILKIDQMRDSVDSTFQSMQAHIKMLEASNERLEKKLVSLETINEELRKSLANGRSFGHLSEESDSTSMYDDSQLINDYDESIISQDSIGHRLSSEDNDPIRVGNPTKKKPQRTLSTLSEPADEISFPSANTPVKRKRWFESEAAAGANIEALSKTEFTRQETIYELIDSEDDYVNDLKVMINIHMSQIRASNLLTDKEVSGLFSNVEQIYAINKEFLDMMQSRRKATSIVEKIGDAFVKRAEYFKVYIAYCANHSTAGSNLKKYLTTNSEFKTLHDHITHQIPEVKHLTLESYLIKPIQRICKYPLLLREILKSTPEDHVDRKDTLEAMEKIEAVITIINDRTQYSDQSQKFLLLQSSIESDEPLELMQPSRKFLIEGNLEMAQRGAKKKERYLVLFNDLLLICKETAFGKGKYHLVKQIPSDRFLVNTMATDLKENSFELIIVGQEKFIVYCSSEDERKKWMKLLEQASLDSLARNEKNKKVAQANPSSLASVGEEDDKSGRHVKAMKLLGLDDPEGANSSRRMSSFVDRRTSKMPSVMEMAAMLKEANAVTNGMPHPDTVENAIEELYITTKDYAPRTDYELSFEKGFHVVITNKKSDEFWKVDMKNVTGYIPVSHIQKVELEPAQLNSAIDECHATISTGVRCANGKRKVTREGYLGCGRLWRQVILTDGTSYYYCPETFETCYHIPMDSRKYFSWFEDPVPNPDWRKIDNNGLKYFYNVITQDTVWELPDASSQ